MLKIKHYKFIFVIIEILQVLFFIAFFQSKGILTYYSLSIIGIVHCVVNILLLRVICKLPIISIPNIFAFFHLRFIVGRL